MSHKPIVAPFLTRHHVGGGTAERSVTVRARHLRVVAHVNLRIGIPKLDGDVSNQLIFESNSFNARDGFYYG